MRNVLAALFVLLAWVAQANAQALDARNNLSDVANAATARTNLAVAPSNVLQGWTPQYITAWNSAGPPTAGGSGYNPGDIVTLSGGTKITVANTATTPGPITNFLVSTPIIVSTLPSQPETQTATTGSGSGATFTLVYVPMSESTSFENFNGGANGITRVGNHAGYGMLNPSLGPSCFGFYSCGGGNISLASFFAAV